MPPPGRRRTLSSLIGLVAVWLCLWTPSVFAASGVLGIDLGTEYIKAALVKPGIPLEIVLTKDSKRKETAAIAFKPAQTSHRGAASLPERLYGGDANALAARFPGDVFSNLKPLLGLEAGSDSVKLHRQRHPGLGWTSISRNASSGQGTVGFASQALDEAESALMVEELLAMELRNIRKNAQVAAGGSAEITDAVLTVPPFYTAEERRALELAAELAGLRVLGLISDGLAVGLNYATSRTFPSISEGAKPEYHLVYDMGAGSTTATVLRFQARSVKDVGKWTKTVQEVQVVSTRWAQDLGGDAWNQDIVEDMLIKLADTSKIKTAAITAEQIRGNGKTMARLWKEAERMRQMLSANTQTSATLEGLMLDEVNFSYKLSRTDFEHLASKTASQVDALLAEAVDAADLTTQSLDSVILHGGAVRTPLVQKHLETAAGAASKVRTNVNADEAAVLGAAFKAAQLSASFRVKDIRAEDTAGFAARLKWTSDGKERQQRIFTPKSVVGAEKLVPFSLPEDFAMEISQVVDEQDVPVSEVRTLNLTASIAKLRSDHHCSPANISTVLSVRLNPVDGLPEVASASVGCEADIQPDGMMDNVKGLFGLGSKRSKGETEGEAEATSGEDAGDMSKDDVELASEEQPLDGAGPAGSESDPSVVTTDAESSTETGSDIPKPSTSTVSIPIALASEARGLNAPLPAERLLRVRSRLVALEEADQARDVLAEAVNTLEAFTYRARDYLSDPSFVTYVPPEVLERLERQLSETSEWIYGDGADAPLAELQQRLRDVKGLVDPVLGRQEEASKREAAVQRLQDSLNSMWRYIELVERQGDATGENNDEEATSSASASESPTQAHPHLRLNPSHLEPLRTSHSSISRWLADKVAAQAQLPPSADPIVSVRELDDQAAQIGTTVAALLTDVSRHAGEKGDKGDKESEAIEDEKGEMEAGGKSKQKDEL